MYRCRCRHSLGTRFFDLQIEYYYLVLGLGLRARAPGLTPSRTLVFLVLQSTGGEDEPARARASDRRVASERCARTARTRARTTRTTMTSS